MSSKGSAKCAKCGITSKEDSSLTFHRFPLPSMHGSLKAKVWAKFCFPSYDSTTNESLEKLHKQHMMLCGKHFDDTSFTSSERKRLNKFAIPIGAKNILAQLRDEQCNLHKESLETKSQQATLQKDMLPMASTSKCFRSIEQTNESVLHSSDLSKKYSKSKSILEDLNMKKLIELTPKKKKLYDRCRKNMTEIWRLRKKLKSVKRCNRDTLSSLLSDNAVNNMIESKMSHSIYVLLNSQIKNVARKLTGRRWTLDDKVLALSLYKKSSSCYRLLRKLFCLPSVTSLKALLNKIPMTCGINNQVFDTIQLISKKRKINHNLCVLAFDEMSIRKHVSYNKKRDLFDGYQDHPGHGRTQDIASRALTFMAIGVQKKWKQPIAFYFSGSCVTADRLSVLIKEVLCACFNAGLEVIGTVCDVDGVNIRALNSLGSSRDQPYFDYEGHEIVTILDPPHLLKCFRNNFLKHDIQFTQDVEIDGRKILGVAKWSHIKELFNIESQNPNFVFAPALTQQHLQPNGKQKMKVYLASQVLSHSVASGLFAKVGINELEQDALGTATVVSKMDNLFDALNGNTPDLKRGKPFLTNMTPTSPHLELFRKMKVFFNQLKFLGARSKPPSQDGWLRTLNAVEKLFYNLKKYNIQSLSVRRLNQDPLENCFGCIRNNCGCNPNPTSVQFIAALKTSIITNLINNNKNRNCLDDDSGVLDNFKEFLSKGCEQTTCTKEQTIHNISSSTPIPIEEDTIKIIEGVEEFDIPQCSGEMQACAYVCGFIAKNIMPQNCQGCKKIMLADPNTEVCHLFTSFKEYNEVSSNLKYIQPSFCKLVENAATLINSYLSENSHTEKITYNLKNICKNLNKDWLRGCEKHAEINFKNIINRTISICIKRFSTLKNRGFIEEAAKKSVVRKIKILKNV